MAMTTLLLDINVWLDYFFPGRSGHQAAFDLIEEAIEGDCGLLIASSSLADFFYISEVILKRESHQGEDGLDGKTKVDFCSEACTAAAWAFVEHLLDTATVVGSDGSDAWLALKYRCIHNDFEDDLVIAAAQHSNASFLVTSDIELLRHSPVPTLSPEDWIKLNRKTA